MAFKPELPVSQLIRRGARIDDVESNRRSKEDYRRQKELEEQRKEGIAPAMVDIETGRDINPHIPEFIGKTPWYVESSGPTLKHQRPHPDRQQNLATIKEWYERGTTGKVAFKYRPGACENCGAMGHKKKECFERPRNVGAKLLPKDIAPDDHVQTDLSLNYDAKRDRWNNYDPAEHKQVVSEYEKMEETRKLIKAQQIKDGIAEEREVEEDEDKYADDMAPGQSIDMDSRTRITVRNLRIREDTAKYLYNLDPNAPYYDPKSRSMRENPFANLPGKEQEAAKFSGENFVKYSGEVVEANQAQVFAWLARSKGIDIHSMAEPTKLEALKKAYEKEKVNTKEETKRTLLEKYGGEEHLDAPPKELLLAQTENYVEYSRTGRVMKGEDRPKVKSRYEEDVFKNNHSSIFGSYWREGRWGYKCCHSFLKNSYCIGEKGFELEDEIFTGLMPKAEPLQFEPKEEKEETETKAPEKAMKIPKRKKSNSDSENTVYTSSGEEDIVNELNVKDELIEDPELDQAYQEEKELVKEREERLAKRRELRREKKRRQKERRAEKAKDETNSPSKKKKRNDSSSGLSDSSSEDDSESEKSKSKYTKDLHEAIKKVKTQHKEATKNDQKRKYNKDSYEQYKQPSSLEFEAYQLTKIHSSDPMAVYMHEKFEKQQKKGNRKKK